MIYYIVAIDPTNHNEWVVSTHNSVVTATKACDNLRKQTVGYEYRIDTTEDKEMIKSNLNEFAKGRLWSVGDPAEIEDTDSMSVTDAERATMTHPFTAIELFPPANGMTTSDCTECGAYVRIPKQVLHATWHNKIADL